MKLALIVVLSCLYFVQAQIPFLARHGLPPPPPRARDARDTEWGDVPMKLDNFDPSNTQTWSMRFIVNDQWFKPGGPIFIMIGAEWTISPGWIQAGNMYDIAKEVGAAMYYTEHRFYGKSWPTSNLSTENLRYLTTDQALADLAEFIKIVKNSTPELANSKVAVFGGSYAATMATWMRQKYPDLVDAAHASSAPLNAKADFYEYMEVVQRSLKSVDPNCVNIIQGAMSWLEYYISTDPAKVKADWNLCYDLDTNRFLDVAYFNNMIAGTFAGIVQYSTPEYLKETCDKIASYSGEYYDKLASFIKYQMGGCMGNYDGFVNYFANPNIDGDSRQWIYQTCDQYGWFQTSNSVNQPFGNTFPVELNYGWCKDIYGTQFTPEYINAGIARTNSIHGALNPGVSKVISVHGGLDPWSAAGLSSAPSDWAPVYVVPNYSHCADMNSLSWTDSEEMQEAKKAVQSYIKEWIQ